MGVYRRDEHWEDTCAGYQATVSALNPSFILFPKTDPISNKLLFSFVSQNTIKVCLEEPSGRLGGGGRTGSLLLQACLHFLIDLPCYGTSAWPAATGSIFQLSSTLPEAASACLQHQEPPERPQYRGSRYSSKLNGTLSSKVWVLVCKSPFWL